jgi:hypothetical protein
VSEHHVTRTRKYQTKFGQFRASITLTPSGATLDCDAEQEPIHQLNGFCWCQPLVETDIADGSHLYIHRRSIDSPHIEASA